MNHGSRHAWRALAEGPMWAKKDGRTNLGEVMNRLGRPIAVVALMLGASVIPLGALAAEPSERVYTESEKQEAPDPVRRGGQALRPAQVR
jgi:hypothetical protein